MVEEIPPWLDRLIHPLGAALSFKADDPVDAALQSAFLSMASIFGRPLNGQGMEHSSREQ